MTSRSIVLRNETIRSLAIAAVSQLPISEDHPMEIAIRPFKAKRNRDQNAKFHALCGDISKSGMQWAGKVRTCEQWKVLLVSAHSVATKEGAEMVPGIEGEFVNIRESTALMSIKRSSSLIEYAIAFCAMNDIRLSIS